MANPGEKGSNVINTVHAGGKAVGLKYQGQFFSYDQGPIPLSRLTGKGGGSADTERKRQPTTENTDAKRADELKSLNLTPYEDLDKAQQYAAAGGTMPIVFTYREGGTGGVWISPPLLDSSSDNFQQTYVYLITQGVATLLGDTRYWFLGKQNLADNPPASGLLVSVGYTNDPAICPLDGTNVACDHSRFNFLADPVEPTVGSFTHVRTVNKYTTAVGLRFKPLYPEDASPSALLERYTLTILRTDNDTGATATVGTVDTSDTGVITAISDTVTEGNYTYSVETTSVLTSGVVPETILFEFRQLSNFPTSVDRTADYAGLQLVIAKANFFDLKKQYSPPSELKQLHIFVRRGIQVDKWRYIDPDFSQGPLFNNFGASNRFPDLVYWWIRNSGKFPNSNFSYISTREIADCARFNARHDISFHAYITSSTNFFSYAQTVAPMMLCSFYDQFGVYGMRPLLPINIQGSISTDPLTPLYTFSDTDLTTNSTDETIIAGSYAKTYKSTVERLPVSVVVTYRAQDLWNLETGQTAVVRYADYAATSPEEAYDMTAFCTDHRHATIFAKYTLATRRYSTHTISFQTARNVGGNDRSITPLDLIRVSLGRTNSEGDFRTETEHYLVDNIEYDSTGIATITASHFPLDGSGVSIISNSIMNGSFAVTV